MNSERLLSAIALRRRLHSEAELSNMEYNTKAILMDYLRTRTSLKVCDMGAWFYAVYRAKAPKKRIAFRADFDALPIDESGSCLPYRSKTPGVSHKCGHDGHSACLAAFADTIDKEGADNDIYFLFQHAEEVGDGAKVCCELIEKEHIDEIYGFHNMPAFPLGEVIVIPGISGFASTGLIFRFKGETSHASEPERGKNPAFAISKLILDIDSLTAPDRYSGLVICTVIRVDVGEEAFGTSAGSGALMLTVRAAHDDEMYSLISALNEKAEGYAKEYGLELSLEYRDTFPETYNHPESAERVRKAANALGLPIAVPDEPFRCSEDFGYYTKLTKGAIFDIGSGEEHAGLHTAEFDFPDEIIGEAVEFFRELAK